MVTAVKVRQYKAKDGTLHPTLRRAQIHENLLDPCEVEAADVQYAGPSSDYHTNVWNWKCGCCGEPGRKVDTMFRKYSTSCDHCYATNLFDFAKHGA